MDSSETYPQMTSFEVVTVMKESEYILRTFCDYYLNQGASLVTVFFDGESPIAPELVPVGVIVIEVCAKDRDEIPSGDPNDHIGLQTVLFTRRQARTECDWLLVVDADEFVTSDRTLNELFGTLSGDVDSIRFPVGEAVWGPTQSSCNSFDSDYFRFALGRYTSGVLSALLYGRTWKLYRRGLLGHCAGKHAVRSAARVSSVGCHFSLDGVSVIGSWSYEVDCNDAFVAHFDAIDCVRWLEKMRMRFDGEAKINGMGKGRDLQVRLAGEALAEGRGERMFEQLYKIGLFQIAILKLVGKIKHSSLKQVLNNVVDSGSKNRW